MLVLVLLLFSLQNYSPASRSSFGAGQVRKRAESPLNQPSQYFSVFDSSTRQVKKLSFFNCKREINTQLFCPALKTKDVETTVRQRTSWSSSFILFLFDSSSASSSSSSSMMPSLMLLDTPGLLVDS